MLYWRIYTYYDTSLIYCHENYLDPLISRKCEKRRIKFVPITILAFEQNLIAILWASQQFHYLVFPNASVFQLKHIIAENKKNSQNIVYM